MPVVLFIKYGMDADKPDPVVNLLPVRFIGVPTKHKITGNIQRAWYPEILVDVITTVGVLVEEALSDIGMNTRRAVIRLEYYFEETWINSVG